MLIENNLSLRKHFELFHTVEKRDSYEGVQAEIRSTGLLAPDSLTDIFSLVAVTMKNLEASCWTIVCVARNPSLQRRLFAHGTKTRIFQLT